MCLAQRRLCDGVEDCDDGKDEMSCFRLTRTQKEDNKVGGKPFYCSIQL